MPTAPPTLTIAIPAVGAAPLLQRSVEEAFAQTLSSARVLVVDDGSGDEVCRAWSDDRRFARVRIPALRDRSEALNAAIAHCTTEAITFHAPEDRVNAEKIAIQSRILCEEGVLDPSLNWGRVGRSPGGRTVVQAVFVGHREGDTIVDDPLELVADLVPNALPLQTASRPHMLVHTGLFRTSLFLRVGGFRPGMGTDRDLRNRILLGGHATRWIPGPLVSRDVPSEDPAGQHDREEAWRSLERRLLGFSERPTIRIPAGCALEGPAWLKRNVRLPVVEDAPSGVSARSP